MGEKYVLDGALLKCSCGTKPAKLQVTENQKVRIQGKLQATDRDVQVPQTFGQCTLKPSGSSYLPCVPALQKWTKTAQKATLGGSKKFLFEDSKCPCATGGEVKVVRHGQIATMGSATEAFKTIARTIPGAMPGADQAPKVVESYWMDADGNRQINGARYGDSVRMFVRTEYVEAGQGLSVTIKEKSQQPIDGSRRFLHLSGTVGADGAARLDPLSTGPDWNTHPCKPTNRLRRLYMEISVAGRVFACPGQVLTLKPPGAAEVTDAFLARRIEDPARPATYQRIPRAALGEEAYVVVTYTGNVEGIRASLVEKEPLLSDGPLPVLQNGTKTTILQLQQAGKENRMVAKVELRPESDEQLDKWHQKLQGKDDEDQESLLSIRVVAESPEEVVYHGTNNSNLFLAEEGDWFEVTDSICYCYQQGLINEPCAGTGTPIKDQQYKDASDELEVEMAVLKAIAKQESKRKSFWSEGQATILFEPHKMWKYLSIDAGKSAVELEKLKQKYPTIVNDQLTNYGAYAQQYKKLNKAKKLHYKSAIKSTSWGKFQVMGFNYTVAFDSPRRMEAAVNQCELQQLKFFIAYIKNINGLVLAMKSKNWQQIAEKYNGPSWKRYNPNYAKHIEKYYYELK